MEITTVTVDDLLLCIDSCRDTFVSSRFICSTRCTKSKASSLHPSSYLPKARALTRTLSWDTMYSEHPADAQVRIDRINNSRRRFDVVDSRARQPFFLFFGRTKWRGEKKGIRKKKWLVLLTRIDKENNCEKERDDAILNGLDSVSAVVAAAAVVSFQSLRVPWSVGLSSCSRAPGSGTVWRHGAHCQFLIYTEERRLSGAPPSILSLCVLA